MTIKAAGILFISGSRVLLMRRSPYADDDAQYWDLPGGKTEGSETPELTAIRECLEETGYVPEGPLAEVATTTFNDVEFTTFANECREAFDPQLNDEHTGYVWLGVGEMVPEGLIHPGVLEVLAMPEVMRLRTGQMNELDAARAIVAGVLPSPYRFNNMSLFALRITGTGTSYRTKGDEYVYRPPENYLTPEFLARCNGLPVIFVHPEGSTLNSDEYKDRSIGTVMYPYIVPEAAEVWGIARIYDDDAIKAMSNPDKPISTSPTVVFRKNSENNTIQLDNGSTLLIEGKPCLLDHVAVCLVGVWDKGGSPSGVLLTNGVMEMTEEELQAKADAEAAEKAEKDKKEEAARADSEMPTWARGIADSVSSLCSRMDSLEGKRADSDKETKADSDKEEKAKADSDKEAEARADAAKLADAEEIRKRLHAIESRNVSLSDADYNALSEAQSRADSLASAFGEQGLRPMQGETPMAYRKRVAVKYAKHSNRVKGVNFEAISDEAAFGALETMVYADAQAAAHSHDALPADGGMREVITRDATGRQISTFVGRSMREGWMNEFTSPTRSVARIGASK